MRLWVVSGRAKAAQSDRQRQSLDGALRTKFGGTGLWANSVSGRLAGNFGRKLPRPDRGAGAGRILG